MMQNVNLDTLCTREKARRQNKRKKKRQRGESTNRERDMRTTMRKEETSLAARETQCCVAHFCYSCMGRLQKLSRRISRVLGPPYMCSFSRERLDYVNGHFYVLTSHVRFLSFVLLLDLVFDDADV